MKTNYKIKILLILLSYLLFLQNVMAEEVFKVGVLLPLSGEYVNAGLPCKNGVLMAIEDLPAEYKDKIQVILEDDMLDPKKSVTALKKLQAGNDLGAIVTFSSGTSQAIAPLAEQAKIPLIAIASDYRVSKDKDYVVNHWVTPELQADLLVEECEARGYKKIARISAIHNATEVFKKEFDDLKGDDLIIAPDDDFQTDARDFRSFITKLKKYDDLDAIFVNLFFGQVGIFAKQTRELGINVPLFGVELFEDKNEVKNSSGALVGQWYVQADEGQENFIKRFLQKFPDSPTFTAANCYDAISLVAESFEELSFPTRKEELNFLLHNLNHYVGAAGTYSASGDNRFSLPAVTKIVTKDGFEKLPPRK